MCRLVGANEWSVVMAARATVARRAPLASAAAGHSVTAAVALAERGKHRETALGLCAATFRTVDRGIGLAHHPSLLKRLFARRTSVFVNGHLSVSLRSVSSLTVTPILLRLRLPVKRRFD